MKKHAGFLMVALILWLMISLAETSALWAQGALSFVARRDFEIGAFANGVISGDFDNDGIADLAVTSSSNQISVLLGNGDGTFQAPIPFTAGREPESVVAGDFNGDGRPDLAVGAYWYGGGNVLINDTPPPNR